ncbi:hypothetical protein [Nostocoides veronense]|uniref:Uncharacterized protein n=1 Tax=Nostocoides veronense TaxID=330836 RepID=A0ABN2M0Y5_9MICO
MNDASQLPVAVDIQPGEDIAAFLQRVADANYLDFPVLTGHRRTARVWENPGHHLLARLASITGVTVERLRAATLQGAYPGMALGRARTGRRYAGQPATCPRGCIDTVAARLNLVVLCTNCEELFIDRLDPTPPPAPARIRHVHREVMATLAATTSSQSARDRLRRLESLMAEVELALWRNWPPRFDGETQLWRTRAVRWVDRNVITGRYTIARPPSITATLLTLTWDASADRATAEAMLDDIAIMADPWDPDAQEMPDWRNPLDARDGLLDLLENLGIQARHVPSILRLTDDPIILPEHHRTHRTAEALALTALASQAHGTPMTIAAAASVHAADSSSRAQRVATRLLDNTHALRRLAVHADRLHSAGLLDRAQARAELRGIQRLPSSALRDIPRGGGERIDREVAAAWVWLDATVGRPAGGPHPSRATADIMDFDTALDPETKLHLRAWWQDRLASSSDLVTADESASPADATEESRDAG